MMILWESCNSGAIISVDPAGVDGDVSSTSVFAGAGTNDCTTE